MPRTGWPFLWRYIALVVVIVVVASVIGAVAEAWIDLPWLHDVLPMSFGIAAWLATRPWIARIAAGPHGDGPVSV